MLVWFFRIHPQNFGPTFPVYKLVVTYGKTGVEYTAAGCHVTVAHYEIQCLTVPGVGQNLVWVVRLEGQSSSIVGANGTAPPTTSYLPPLIYTLASLDSTINPQTGYVTQGGVTMIIRGRSFGPAGTDIRLLFSTVWDACIANSSNCLP